MFYKIVNTFLLFILAFTYPLTGEILTDQKGNKCLTLGSTKDEVLEILGTPTQIYRVSNEWWYGREKITFNSKDEIVEYSNSNALKILLLPKSQKLDFEQKHQAFTSNNSNTSYSTKSDTSNKTFSSVSSGYGEISKSTGRPKTVSVKGYYRKNGTYVKPHYRSAPRRK